MNHFYNTVLAKEIAEQSEIERVAEKSEKDPNLLKDLPLSTLIKLQEYYEKVYADELLQLESLLKKLD